MNKYRMYKINKMIRKLMKLIYLKDQNKKILIQKKKILF